MSFMLPAYYRTLSRLRWSQLFWRARYTLERRRRVGPHTASKWRWAGIASPRVRNDIPTLPISHGPARGEAEEVALLRQGIFRHLNEERKLGCERPDWLLGPATVNRLWTITLHYHAWAYALAEAATAEASELFTHYVTDWIERCKLETPGARALAWNSYAIATRLSWWVRSYRALGDAWWESRPSFRRAFLESLWQQAAYLQGHLEWDLRGNHLLRDAVGLAWAGRFFNEEQAKRWLATATRLAVEQASEQVLPDGGHFERSPMYHLHVMEDIGSLAMLLEDADAQTQLRNTGQRMAEYLAWLRHPDGEVALLNDGALHTPGARIDLEPRRGGRYFSDTGIVVWHGQPWTIFFDVGAVGPDYQPGHTHADTLTLECSYRGRRLFVDPGTCSYDHDQRRRYDRSTEAHNTVSIDRQDSSEVWHIFRVGRRAYPLGVHVDYSDGGMTAEASHNGYDHLPGRPRHTRTIEIAGGAELTVTDRINGGGSHFVQGGFLLDPTWKASATADGWVLTDGTDRLRMFVRGPESLVRFEEQRPYHPEYGKEISAQRLGWRRDGPLPVNVTVAIAAV